MKTKIIYISGSEIFEMADVRAALEEVRSALNLSRDTVLFGVPVDAESAFVASDTVAKADVAAPAIDTVVAPVVEEVVAAPVAEIAPIVAAEEAPVEAPDPEIIEDTVVEEIAPQPEEAPKKRATRTRKTVAKAKKEEIAPVAEEVAAPVAESAPIPILSVLASKAEDTVTPDAAPVADTEDEQADAPVADVVTEIKEEIVVETVALDDIITDEAPVDAGEKTLEELLESMKPLREDVPKETIATDEVADDDFEPIDMSADTDATLEQLAAEFAQNEDKIGEAPKQGGRGKIGKLKNILPFKKAKRDDNGLMGDLFGWAGIAANDDDFAIPGFFTTAASKK